MGTWGHRDQEDAGHRHTGHMELWRHRHKVGSGQNRICQGDTQRNRDNIWGFSVDYPGFLLQHVGPGFAGKTHRQDQATGHVPSGSNRGPEAGTCRSKAELCLLGPCRRYSCPQHQYSPLWRKVAGVAEQKRTGMRGGKRSPHILWPPTILTLGSEEYPIARLVAVGLAIVLRAEGRKCCGLSTLLTCSETFAVWESAP